MSTQIEIGFCNANLPRRRFLLQGVQESRDSLQAMHCDGGLETHEIFKNTRLTTEIAALAIMGAFSNYQDGRPLIGSVHDSWWHLDTPLGPHPKLKLRLERIFYWEAHTALRGMRRMQGWAGQPITAVVYPDAQKGNATFNASNAPFKHISFQPTAELISPHTIRHIQLLQRYMGRQGLTAVCLDTFHYNRQGKQGQKPLPSFETVWPALFMHRLVPEIHVSFRPDLWRFDPNAAMRDRHSLQAAVDGSLNGTLTGEMLSLIKEYWQPSTQNEKLRVIPEIPAPALSTLRTPPKSYQDFLAIHRDINATIRQTLQ